MQNPDAVARGRDEVLLSVAGEGKALHFGRRLGTLPAVNYEVEIADEAKAKLRSMPKEIRRLIGYRIFLLQDDLGGDVKKLRGSKNEYRLRVGNSRVLFELQGRKIMIYAVGDRKEIYR